MARIRVLSLLALVSSILWHAQSLASERCVAGGNHCSLGIFPHTNIRQLQSTYSSVSEDMSMHLDTSVRLVSTSSMESYENNLVSADYDIALVGPQQYVLFAAPAGYLPLARRNSSFKFLLVTLADSPIQSAEDLAGKTLGLISSTIERHLLARNLLSNADPLLINLIKHRQFNNQRACTHALASRLVDACGVISVIHEIVKHEVGVALKVVAEGDDVPNSLFVIHPEVAKEQQALLKEYLLERPNYVEALDTDYDVVRGLRTP